MKLILPQECVRPSVVLIPLQLPLFQKSWMGNPLYVKINLWLRVVSRSTKPGNYVAFQICSLFLSFCGGRMRERRGCAELTQQWGGL